MEIIALLAILVQVLPSWVSANEVTLGVPVNARSLLSSDDCSGIYGLRCLNCTHLQLCADREISLLACTNINSNTPYCSNNGCSAAAVSGCDPPFICTGTGLFPDLTDCTRYYLCGQPGGAAELFQCPPQFVYDSRTEICKRRRVANDCQTVDCRRFSEQYVVFKPDPSILAYCPKGVITPVIYRCPDSVFGEFDPNTLQCNFKCPAEGRFPDRLDCHKFYECFRSGTTFGVYHQDCGLNFKYDRESRRCINDDPKCSPEVPPATPSDGGDPGNEGGLENGGNVEDVAQTNENKA